MPTVLDEHQVADSLTQLPSWSGDPSRIRRTVTLPAGQMEQLLSAVALAADDMNHHPEVDRSGDATTFALWTHSVGGVTDLDIALARRIDDLAVEVSGAAPPTGAAG